MAKSAPVGTTVTTPSPVKVYEGLLARGFSPEEAAMNVAQLWGLQVTHETQPIHWTIREITNLLFLSHRVGNEKNGKGKKA